MAETDGYQPTSAERENARSHPDVLKVSGDQTFVTLQGEGQSIGKPAVFLRLQNCNLQCDWCDTKYTWDRRSREYWQESEDLTYSQVRELVTQYWDVRRLVVTGGEPMLQQRKIAAFIAMLPDWAIEIETNGTIASIPELAGRVQFNVSPKLANSKNTPRARYKPDVLRQFNQLELTTFKFVASAPSDLDEVSEIVTACELDQEKIIIMPEGTTQEEIREHGIALVDAIREKGWRLIPRLQVMLWGAQRRV